MEVIGILIILIFQVVFAEIHGDSYFFIFNVIFGGYLVFNVVGNLLSISLVDTSVFATQETMTVSRFLNDPSANEWNLCEKCEIVVPPRSWHCDTCRCCQLKRDHHCIFASNCIGYLNHRFFMVFLVHFCIATIYATCYNSYYIWILNGDQYLNLYTLIKMLLPMLMLVNSTMKELNLFFYLLTIIGACFTGVLLIFHGNLIIRNTTTHERNKGSYDGGLKKNLSLVFGKRWLSVFFWPFVKSDLPEVYWKTEETIKNK